MGFVFLSLPRTDRLWGCSWLLVLLPVRQDSGKADSPGGNLIMENILSVFKYSYRPPPLLK